MANINNNGGVTAAMLTATGRESGPDIVLNVEKTAIGGHGQAPVNGIITDNSSITEVLNIVAYLTIPTPTRANAVPIIPNDAPWFNKEHSVVAVNGDVPGRTDATGFYINNALAVLDNSLFQAVGPVAGTILYDLDTMAVVAAGAPAVDVIPVCIRKRNPPGGGNPLQVADVAAGAAAGNGNIPQGGGGNLLVSSLMSDCVKQMINILANTRNIFGPKGWTALFSKVKGGGAGAGKNNAAKRTHRQHRRKYSSKHY
jgi:hypothetical protein